MPLRAVRYMDFANFTSEPKRYSAFFLSLHCSFLQGVGKSGIFIPNVLNSATYLLITQSSGYFPELTHMTFDPDPLTTLQPHSHDDPKPQLTSAFTLTQEVVENRKKKCVAMLEVLCPKSQNVCCNQPVCLQVKHLSEKCSARLTPPGLETQP